MAILIPGPLYVNKREVAPVHQITTQVVVTLLVTVLQATTLPVGTPPQIPLQVLQPGALVQNADTSQSAPQALLTAIVQPPLNVTPFLGRPFPIHERPLADTTRGTPKPLLAEALLPIGQTVQLGPQRVDWLAPPDTSRGTAKTLLAEVVLPRNVLPFYSAAAVTRPDNRVQNGDTSESVAKVLLPEVALPNNVAPFLNRPFPVHERPLFDTTRGAPAPLLAPQPFSVAPFFAAPQPFGVNPDTSRSAATFYVAAITGTLDLQDAADGIAIAGTVSVSSTPYPGPAGAPGPAGKPRVKKYLLVEDEEITPKQLRVVIDRAQGKGPKLEPSLEQIARTFRAFEPLPEPTYPVLPLYDGLAQVFAAQQRMAELEALKRIAEAMQDEEDVEMLLLSV